MNTLSGILISNVGIGTYGVGGRGHRDMELTEVGENETYIDALAYTLRKGFNFTEISQGYGHGQSLALFKDAFDKSGIDRKDFFLTHSLYPKDLATLNVLNTDVDNFYKIMRTDYTDSILITQSLVAKYGDEIVYHLLHHLLDTEKTRYVSLSNSSPSYIKTFKKEFKDKFIAHEGHLSFEVRALQDKGVFETCDELGVTNIIWRPLRRGATEKNNWPLLIELAEKYQKTPNQIILNWMCSLNYHPMVMSASRNHIDENAASTSFKMSEVDYKRITEFRPPNYHPPEVDWEKSGQGDSIVTLVNDFEQHIS